MAFSHFSCKIILLFTQEHLLFGPDSTNYQQVSSRISFNSAINQIEDLDEGLRDETVGPNWEPQEEVPEGFISILFSLFGVISKIDNSLRPSFRF